VILVDQSPGAQKRQTKGDAGDPKSPALHAEHGLALQNLEFLLLKLSHTRKVAVRSKAEECTAS
jgi:hypothetical protein